MNSIPPGPADDSGRSDGLTVARLTEAVRGGDTERVRDMLRARPELVNTVEAWNNEHTALHYAVLGRMPEMMRLLMQFAPTPVPGSPRTPTPPAR